MRTPLTRLKPINAMCRCNFDPLGGGTWRRHVEACTGTGYQLCRFRPFSFTKNAKPQRESATRSAGEVSG